MSKQKKLEANRKRMEALNLPQLSQALRNSGSSPKPSPMKRAKPRVVEKLQMVEVRRSPRVANKHAPDYKVQWPPHFRNHVGVDRVVIPRRICGSRSRDLSNRFYASDEARQNSIEKAEKLDSGLEPGYPTFIKSMLQSHVTGGFWLGLPSVFCKSNLPKSDAVMTLIDEDGNEHETIYLARKTGLSGGWKGFAVAHELVDGDALVFQLVRPTAFKVYSWWHLI
ncbi:hypothetical protein Tsubulata_048547 [Turnera subulata]|uniref:TF-B3 domain-containing protein n=1 Tax=Turnera subulata TaxID=218843 RepID=A0A9Q0FGP8_9ROSI|nr:hypothetical protein Tsubulata_048547 [Turnera subulata]